MTILFSRRGVCVAVIASLAFGLLLTVPAQAQGAAARHVGAHCQPTQVPVSLPVIGSAHIYGELCVPDDGGGKARGVQLLAHGGTYGHNYFDWPADPDRYSYLDKALKAGYATFNGDRLGDGESTHPPSALNTFENGAEALHQVISKLRGGKIGEHTFSRVVWVGHSMGSLTAWFEAQRFRDVDAFVLTGILHNVKATFAPKLINLTYPARLDPKFLGNLPDLGYLTSLPNERGDTFYYKPGADQAVIDEDEQLKQLLSPAELAEIAVIDIPPPLTPTFAITVPTLLVTGDHDGAFCGSLDGHVCTAEGLLAAERPYFRPQARLRVVTAANSGHDLQLHRTAPQTDAAILNWIDALS